MLFLGYESALEYWRAAGCGLAPLPEQSAICSVADEAIHKKEISALAPQLKLANRPPLHVLVSKREAINSSRCVKRHLCTRKLPAGAFCSISDMVLVASPAL